MRLFVCITKEPFDLTFCDDFVVFVDTKCLVKCKQSIFNAKFIGDDDDFGHPSKHIASKAKVTRASQSDETMHSISCKTGKSSKQKAVHLNWLCDSFSTYNTLLFSLTYTARERRRNNR